MYVCVRRWSQSQSSTVQNGLEKDCNVHMVPSNLATILVRNKTYFNWSRICTVSSAGICLVLYVPCECKAKPDKCEHGSEFIRSIEIQENINFDTLLVYKVAELSSVTHLA